MNDIYISQLMNCFGIKFQMVKEKPNSTRIYDKDGFRRRAACICVRSDAEAEVIIKSKYIFSN